MGFNDINIEEFEMLEELKDIANNKKYYIRIIDVGMRKICLEDSNTIIQFSYDNVFNISSKIIINGFYAENPNITDLCKENIKIDDLNDYSDNIFKNIRNNKINLYKNISYLSSNTFSLEGINISKRATLEKYFYEIKKNIEDEIILYIRDKSSKLYRLCFFLVRKTSLSDDIVVQPEINFEEVKHLPKNLLFIPKKNIKVNFTSQFGGGILKVNFSINEIKFNDVFVINSNSCNCPIGTIQDNINILRLQDSFRNTFVDDYFIYNYIDYIRQLEKKEDMCVINRY